MDQPFNVPTPVTARTELQLQRYNDVLIERILNYRTKESREYKLKYIVEHYT